MYLFTFTKEILNGKLAGDIRQNTTRQFTSIRWIWYVIKKITTNFHVTLMYFFKVVSVGEKSTLFRRNFGGQKIDVISRSFVRRDFNGRKIDRTSNYLHSFFYKQRLFSTHPHCCLTFSWIELQMLLRCCLKHITIVILRHILYLV